MKLERLFFLSVLSSLSFVACDKGEKPGNEDNDSNDKTTETVELVSIKLDKADAELKVGEKIQLSVIVEPEECKDYKLEWTSSDADVAVVDKNGEVTALVPGKTDITVSSGELKSVCKLVVKSKASVGDFYYSDGTFSSELDMRKLPIGIVFWTGNPAMHDDALKREHPECVNGLVVALSESSDNVYWQTRTQNYQHTIGSWVDKNLTDYISITSEGEGIDDNLNKILGYNNTKAIEEFNAAPENKAWPADIMKEVDLHRMNAPAPETSSGWYLPSIKEWSLICAGDQDANVLEISIIDNIEKYLNPKLKQVNDAIPFEWNGYWSSTELPDKQCYSIFADSGYIEPSSKGYPAHVRCVLAF